MNLELAFVQQLLCDDRQALREFIVFMVGWYDLFAIADVFAKSTKREQHPGLDVFAFAVFRSGKRSGDDTTFTRHGCLADLDRPVRDAVEDFDKLVVGVCSDFLAAVSIFIVEGFGRAKSRSKLRLEQVVMMLRPALHLIVSIDNISTTYIP